MKYAIEMGSVALKYIPSFIKIGLGIQKLIKCESRTHTDDVDINGPETESSSIYCAQLSRVHLKTGTEISPRNFVF
jgi:hypothetical protein